MTSKSGFLVLILIASGFLNKGCGDGQIGASPRSSEGGSTPDQPNVDEPTPDQPDVDERAFGVTGVPYGHVTPADVEVSIGPGVIAAYPTITYAGSCTITTPGTTIENRIVNCGILRIEANDVTIRNSVLNLTGTYTAIRFGEGGGSTATGFTVEYSHVNYQTDGKVFEAFNGSGNGDYRNMTVRNNHVEGGHDFFYIEGRFDGLLVENNVMGSLGCADGSDPHADGFQIGEAATASGTMTIRGNYFDPQKACTKTAIIFAAGGTPDIIFESNRLTIWGANTVWCAETGSCIVRYNIYDADWEAAVGNRCSCSGGGGPACCGYPNEAFSGGTGTDDYECNRYESDGSFIEQEWVSGATHVTSACPSYPPQ